MRRSVIAALCLATAMSTGVTLTAQDADQLVFAPAATSKFVNMPGLPVCMTIAVQRGDPTAGPAILLLKLKAGCKVPWHWHTAGEQVMVVSGLGKAEMKGNAKPAMVKAGDFIYMPSKHIHQLTALTALTIFDAPDGAFDIHYVDASGNEIPPDQALPKAPVKAAPAKTAKPPAAH
ncbi:MAG: cupin domain-containing protein [Terracidiphilus sp.]